MSKRDRHGVRNATDIERKYNLGKVKKTYSEVKELSVGFRGEIAQVSAALRQEIATEIGSVTKKQDALGKEMGEVTQQVNEFAAELEVFEGKLEEANETADAASKTATTANETATKATQTANAASEVASSAAATASEARDTANEAIQKASGVEAGLAEVEAGLETATKTANDAVAKVTDVETDLENTTQIATVLADTMSSHFSFGEGSMTFLGGIAPEVMPGDTDLNDIMTPNKYVSLNVSRSVYVNCPVSTGTFSLEVEAGGDEGQLMQRLTHFHKTDCKVYLRFYYGESWGEWVIAFDGSRKGIFEDSGWIPLTVDSAFKVRNDDDNLKPVFKVTGNVVTVCGVVSNVAEMTSTSSGIVFASGIPEEYRPHMDHHIVCQGSGMNRWQLSVKTDGTLMLSRYGISEQGTMAANTWLPFSCTYQV